MDRAAHRRTSIGVRKVRQAAWKGAMDVLEQRVLLSASASQAAFDATPALFIQNKGQWTDSSIRYALRTNAANILMTDHGPLFQVFQKTDKGVLAEQFSAQFDGANTVTPTGQDRSTAKFNFYQGDQSRWRSGVSGYETIVYNNLYDGVDLYTWGKSDSIKYEFHVAPGADYKQVSVSYDGIQGLSIDSKGNLHIKTKSGELVDDAPFVYQMVNGKRVKIKSSFKLVDNDTFTFQLNGSYDATKELIIDPILQWSGYMGGEDDESGQGIATDSSGNVYVVGNTTSDDFLPLTGPDLIRDDDDAFAAKFNNSGVLQWSTFIGGTEEDSAADVAVDSSGNVYIVGSTQSDETQGFPVISLGLGFRHVHGGNTDGYILQLTPSGTPFWSSYMGGTGNDRATSVVVDGDGVIYIAGVSGNNSFGPIGGTGFDITPSGNNDAFVMRVSNRSLDWTDFIGGGGNEQGLGLAVGSDGTIYVGGSTTTTNSLTGYLPDNEAPLSSTYGGGTSDGFLASISNDGVHLNYLTFVGGPGVDSVNDVAVDSDGNVAVAGNTNSNDATSALPLTFLLNSIPSNVLLNRTGTGNNSDAFVTKLDSQGNLIFGTYLGSSAADSAQGVAFDPDGNVIVVGNSANPTGNTAMPFPIANAFAGGAAYHGGNNDVFIVKLSPDGTLDSNSMLSLYGGGGGDVSGGVAVDFLGAIVITGQTTSEDLVLGESLSSLSSVVFDNNDVFVARIADVDAIPPVSPTNLQATAISMTRIDLRWQSPNPNTALTIEVYRNGVKIATLARTARSYSDTGLQPNTTYFYFVLSANNAGVGAFPSNTAIATTRSAAMAAPGNLAATAISAKQINITWVNNADNASNFEISRQLTAGVWSVIKVVSSATTSYQDKDPALLPSTSYSYRVRALNAFTASSFSNVATVITKPATFIVAPSALRASKSSSTSIDLGWVDNSDNEANFAIQRKLPGGSYSQIALVSANTTSYRDSTANPSLIYIYRIRAVNGPNVSTFSNEATNNLKLALATPTRFEALAVAFDQIKLTWLDKAVIETKYLLERAVNKASDFRLVAQIGANKTSYTDKDLLPNKRYYYRLRATDGSSFSAYSAQTGDTTFGNFETAPTVPNGLRASSVTATSVKLTWADRATTERNYLIERSTSLDGPFTVVKTLDRNATSFVNTGLTAGKTYYFRVRAIDGGVRSAPSSIVTVNTLAVASAKAAKTTTATARVASTPTVTKSVVALTVSKSHLVRDLSDRS